MHPITLYQHTPLIHFQADQAGATLRATDVKPRLDRWIITRFGDQALDAARQEAPEANWTERERYLAGWEILTAQHPNWIALSDPREERQKSLNYRLRIVASQPHPLNGKTIGKEKDVELATYFADVGDSQDSCISFYNNLQLTIDAADSQLAQLIDDEAKDFFYATNFGTRATKGFGSFSLAAKPEGWTFKFKIPHQSDEDLAYPSPLGSENGELDLYQRLFRHLDFFYRSLRAGINCFTEPDKIYDQDKKRAKTQFNQSFYMKPLVFQYAMDLGITWEKKLIKRRSGAIYDGQGNRARPDDIRSYFPNDGFMANANKSEDRWPKWYNGQNASAESEAVTEATVRDVFGLSTDQSWNNWKRNGKELKVDKSSATSGPNAIPRAPSPLTFVPVRERYAFAVYVYARQPEDFYLTHEYEVNVLPRNLKVFPGFDMATFLDDYLAVPILERSVVIKDKTLEERNEDPLYLLLERLYAQARGSLNLANIAQP